MAYFGVLNLSVKEQRKIKYLKIHNSRSVSDTEINLISLDSGLKDLSACVSCCLICFHSKISLEYLLL